MKRVLTLLGAALCALVLLVPAASGATVQYSGSLTASSPTYSRVLPSGGVGGTPTDCTTPPGLSMVGTAVHYHAQTFTVGTTGTYDILSVTNTFSASMDSFLAIYAGSFNPAAPLTNLVYANDDRVPGTDLRAQITCTLNTGTTYILVTSPFANTNVGDFTNQISGPGTISGAGLVTAVTFRGLTAARTSAGVAIRWRTASEVDALGFHVYRQVGVKRVRVNGRLISANGRGAYSFLDRKVPKAKTVRYWVQVVNLDGTRRWYGPARVLRS